MEGATLYGLICNNLQDKLLSGKKKQGIEEHICIKQKEYIAVIAYILERQSLQIYQETDNLGACGERN